MCKGAEVCLSQICPENYHPGWKMSNYRITYITSTRVQRCRGAEVCLKIVMDIHKSIGTYIIYMDKSTKVYGCRSVC